MPNLQFLFSPGGSFESYEVFSRGRPIGLVWKVDNVWFADPDNMADPRIAETTRDAAGHKLWTAASSDT